MSQWIKAIALAELLPGTAKTCMVAGKELGLYNVAGKVYATENTCYHQGAPLADGRLEGTIITCPWHAWKYDVTNGQCTRDESIIIKTFPTKIEGEDIFVEV